MSQKKISPTVSHPVSFKVHFNTVLQSAHRSSSTSPSVLLTKILYAFLSVLFMPHAQPILDLIDIVTVGTLCKTRSSSLCSFLYTPVNSSPLDPDITFSTLFCNTHKPRFVTHTKKLNIAKRLREKVKGIPHTEESSGLSTSRFEPDTLEQESCVLQLSQVSPVDVFCRKGRH